MNKLIPRSIIDILPENIYWMDRDGRIIGCNHNQAKIFGFETPEELEGKNIFDVASRLKWPDAIPQSIRQNDIQIMETRKEVILEEEVFWSGQQRYVLSFKHPWIDEDGKVLGIVGISVDITERKTAEIELQKAKSSAEAANRAKSEFLANLSHDLRTPLSSLVALSTHIAKKSRGSALHGVAVDAEECAQQMLLLIDEVLEITRIEAGQFPNQERIFKIEELINSAVKLMSPAAKQKDLHLEVVYDPSLPKWVFGRYQPMYRMLLNLLSNAIKFSHHGNICVSVKLIDRKDENIKMKMSVRDTGIGIAEIYHQQIFEQFERLNAAYEGKYEGRGLGLYIVKQFAELTNASIHVQSAENQGTTIDIEFPLKIADESLASKYAPVVIEAPSPKINPHKSIQPPITCPGSGKAVHRILLVEDNQIAAKVAQIALANLDADIDLAETGLKAIDLAAKHPYDLVFLDIGLPDISGLEVSKAIRKNEADNNRRMVPIIALTAHLDCARRALEAGIQQIISKPLTVAKAEIILKNWMQSPESLHTSDTSSARHIDLSMSEKLVGNRELAKSMLEKFIGALPRDLQKIQTAYNSGKRELLKEAVHYLNGGSSYAGVPLLKRACSSLESALIDDFSDSEILELSNDLYQEAEKVLQLYQSGEY